MLSCASNTLKMTRMIERFLKNRLASLPKSLLLLGPRQVGKSTLCKALNPDLLINLADESLYTQYLRDPSLLGRRLAAEPEKRRIMIDEVQRIPSLLNTVQAILDQDHEYNFILTGSSARKLKRGKANLLPGRIFIEHLPPLVFWELGDQFNLEKALTIGCLPEIYLQPYGPELLESYVTGYLREEIQAEALTKDLGAYARFLDLAAGFSGQYLNYAKLASDSEINKETIRRYIDILIDTLLVERIPSFTLVDKNRRARQKDKFIFFDLGVRNNICGRRAGAFSREELGTLFEQWLILQVVYYNKMHHKHWRITTYKDANSLEVDLIIEQESRLYAIEIKSATRADERMFKSLARFEVLAKRPVHKLLVYQGDVRQKFEAGLALPYRDFLTELEDLPV